MSQHHHSFGRISPHDARRQQPRIVRRSDKSRHGGGPRFRFRLERLEPRMMLSGDAQTVPDFAVTDVNSDSATFNQVVSPSDYLQQVSGWYFGHAT